MTVQSELQKRDRLMAAHGKEGSTRLARPNLPNVDGTLTVNGVNNLSVDNGQLVYPFTIDEVEKVDYFRLKDYDWYVIYLNR